MPDFAFPKVGRPGLAYPPSRIVTATIPRYYAPLRLPLPISGRFTRRSLPDTLHTPVCLCPSRLLLRGRLAVLPRSNGYTTPGLLLSRYTSASGNLYKETGGSPK
ncbi:MAG: hypothetical protein ACE5NG_02910, partial [bacterium]